MGGMMNAKRYTGCRCCVDPDDVARRQIEKREWKKDVEEDRMKDITPEMICLDPAPKDDLIVGEYPEGENE